MSMGASSDDDIPDDYFEGLVDSKLIEDLVENATGTDMFDSGSNRSGSRENSPRMARCLAEIETLTKDIERRKKNLQKELSDKGMNEVDLRDKLDRDVSEGRSHRGRRRDRRGSRSFSRSRSRSRNRRSTSKPINRSPSYRERQRRERERDRERERERSRRQQRSRRRSKSASPNGKHRSSSVHKNISFLEELAQTFAAQGKPMDAEEILAQAKGNSMPMHHQQQSAPMRPMMNAPMNEPMMMPPMQMQYQQAITYPNVGYPPNMFYGVDGLAGAPLMQAPQMMRTEVPMPIPSGPPSSTPANNAVESTSVSGPLPNQKALLERCAQAVELLRSEENKVSKLRFLFTRTHIDNRNQPDEQLTEPYKSPFTPSPSNVIFRFNSTKPISASEQIAPKPQLPPRSREAVKALSINNETFTTKLRSREIVTQLSLDFKAAADSTVAAIPHEVNVPLPSRTANPMNPSTSAAAAAAAANSSHTSSNVSVRPMRRIETSNTRTQTDPFECEKCVARDKRVFVSKGTQAHPPQKNGCSQTDEDDYRSPLIESLSRLSAAQLVAIKDFIGIMVADRPQNTVDMCNLRERMMDIYNLSQRDSDAVRTAQRNRLDEPLPVVIPKRFRSTDRDFDNNSSHGRHSNSSANFSQTDRFDSEERQMHRRHDRQRSIEHQDHYDMDMVRQRQMLDDEEHQRRMEEEEEHERERQRRRIVEEQEYELRLLQEAMRLGQAQKPPFHPQNQSPQQQLPMNQQQQHEKLFGFANREDRPSFAARNARGAFRNFRGGASNNFPRGGRGRKF